MRIRWRNLELPTRVVADQDDLSDTYGKFYIEPFERGYGTTIGNSLRRVLLSLLEGTAVTSIKLKGVDHEFSSIEGVREDVTAIILNVKNLLVRLHTDESVKLTIDVDKKGDVTAADIEAPHNAEVVNTDLHIATLSVKTHFQLEMEVRKGRGYVTAEENAGDEQEIGVIPIDSVFSPVYQVRYRTEDTRVGKFTNYDRLILELWTDGTVHPEMALVEASKICRKHLNPFVQYFELGNELPGADIAEMEVQRSSSDDEEAPAAASASDEVLDASIDSLDLSVRAKNCLDAEGIRTLGDLVVRDEADMLKVRNFGKTSLREIKKKLEERGLSLGMK
ncbi:MAG: DNA-directed RNA polymerase subunit alpha [Planctomycetota bacterium]